MDAVDQEGYYLKVFPLSNPAAMESVFENLLKRQVSAVILQGLDNATVDWFQEKLFEHTIPFCLLGSSFSSPRSIRVVSDDHQGAENAIAYMAKKGHQNILFLNGQSDWPAFVIREEGAKSGAEKYDIHLSTAAVESFRPGSSTHEDIEQIRNQIGTILTQQKKKVTAIFCPNDTLAVLAVQACARLGIKVPHELSIMGYSLSMLSLYSDPRLTSVAQPHQKMGFSAAIELVEALRRGTKRSVTSSVEIMLPTSIYEGETVVMI